VARPCGSQAELREGRLGRLEDLEDGRDHGDGGMPDGRLTASTATMLSTRRVAGPITARLIRARPITGRQIRAGPITARPPPEPANRKQRRARVGGQGPNTKIARVSISLTGSCGWTDAVCEGEPARLPQCHPAHSHSHSHQIEVLIYLILFYFRRCSSPSPSKSGHPGILASYVAPGASISS
jgi:hypothetical protein